MADEDSWLIDFPTLGHLVCAWIERHCRQPDGPLRGRPVVLSDWQYWLAANRWRIRVDAPYVPPEEVTVDNPMVLNQAFTYRMTLTVGPQKWGKGPCTAFFTAARAAGPPSSMLGTGRRHVPLRRQRLPVRLGVAIQSGRAERP